MALLALTAGGGAAPAMLARGGSGARQQPVPPGVPGVLLLGQEAVDRGDYGAAVRWFETAIALRPRLAVAHTCLGLALVGDERLEEAEEAFGHGASLDPANPMARYHQARVRALLGDHGGAMDALSTVAARFPRVREAALADEAFASLRDHPRFLQLVGALDA